MVTVNRVLTLPPYGAGAMCALTTLHAETASNTELGAGASRRSSAAGLSQVLRLAPNRVAFGGAVHPVATNTSTEPLVSSGTKLELRHESDVARPDFCLF